MRKRSIKAEISRSLLQLGFTTNGDKLVAPILTDKASIRDYHRTAVGHVLRKNLLWIAKNETKLFEYFADGSEVDPLRIYPSLKLVESEFDNALFRYATYTWSVPVSKGFGRRMRYLVFDESNGKLIGLIGLTDPVIGLRARDRWIGWDRRLKESNLVHVMDAHVLGALPPYSYLLGGKMVATLATSKEVRRRFRKKYEGRSTIISRRLIDPELVLLTTTSALGMSSMLDRLRFRDRQLWLWVGMTEGFGAFQFNNGLFDLMFQYLDDLKDPVLRRYDFGKGPNWRFRVIRECLKKLGGTQVVLTHGVKRGVYVAPMAHNPRRYLTGQNPTPRYFGQGTDELFAYFRERYLLPRSQRDSRYKQFSRESIRVTSLAAKT